MELEQIVADIQAGDTSLYPALWEATERFIRMQARRRLILTGIIAGAEYDDLCQCGYIALTETIKSYEPDKGSFLNYLNYHLLSAFSEAQGIRTSRRDAMTYADSLDAPIWDDGDDTTKGDLVEDPRAGDAFSEAEEKMFIAELRQTLTIALDSLPAIRREIIKARYYKGHTLKEIAASHGVTFSQARQYEGDGLRQLRQTARKYGLDQFVELHTPYYRHYGLEYMRRTGNSPVEAVFFERERLRAGVGTESEVT